MELSTRYNPQETEPKWYDYWLEHNYFHSEPDDREPYTIMIPPPNVTGVLHMGHMLNNTIQDILIRKARLEGKNACWVPGTDHASIATEAKVVKMLRERGIKKGDLSRDEFMKYAWEWKEEYGGIILKQLQKLGASCDWERTYFTMEDRMSRAVISVFVDLYKKGKLYHGKRMTNWDPEAKTVLSNEEVIYKEERSQLFHIRYKIEGTADEYIIIATQRPETIMADTSIAVHPEDERFKHLVGKNALIPLINKPIPILADSYVDREFGTGALKITPAHDQNDYEVGIRHDLPVVDILNEDGTLNEAAQILVGEDRFSARKKIKKLLEEAGNLVELEDYTTTIGRSERTDAVVEPRLTVQWFLDMRDFAKTALEAVKSGDVTFYPENMWNMYYNWLREDNVRDWCISRQLWWGQRIPAWYLKDADVTDENRAEFVAETAAEALELAREKTGNPNLTLDDLKQDEDVVDTWFSSWLVPLSSFNGFDSPEELKYYYPTTVLVTGWDIMYLWVARMIMAGYEWSGDLLGEDFVQKHGRQPFHDVYFTGMVRDNKRRKMSKSLGNSPDALTLIDTYGADGVRFGMMASSAAGNDIIFDAPFDSDTKEILNQSKLCEQGRNFCNKMWNALRLVKGWDVSETVQDRDGQLINQLAIGWMEEKLSKVLTKLEDDFRIYRLSDALMTLYKFIWDDFCSWYLEMIKPAYGEPIDQETLDSTIELFSKLMTVLHPFMPFVTEEIWQQLADRLEGEDCIVSEYPEAKAFDEDFINKVERAKQIVAGIREVRNSKGVKMKEALNVYGQDTVDVRELLAQPGIKPMIIKMANLESLQLTKDEIPNSVSILAGTDTYFVELKHSIDTDAERERLEKDLEYYQGFVKTVEKKLSNEKFVNNAPEQVVELERKKLADGQAKIKSLEEALAQLN